MRLQQHQTQPYGDGKQLVVHNKPAVFEIAEDTLRQDASCGDEDDGDERDEDVVVDDAWKIAAFVQDETFVRHIQMVHVVAVPDWRRIHPRAPSNWAGWMIALAAQQKDLLQ